MAGCVYVVWLGAQRARSDPSQAEKSEVADVLEVYTASLKPWPEAHRGEAQTKRESSTAKAQHTHQRKREDRP